jgi:ribosomal protein S18 acetylase RimI-like enzyme
LIEYLDSLEEVDAGALAGGFFVGWPNSPSPERHLAILRGSSHVVLARESASGAVVGFVNAISDGVLTAYIPLLEVLPAWQGAGIGSELMRRMLAQLGELYMIDLLCDVELQPWYARLGMRPATGMLARNYARQSCETRTA